jgi:hypothetical protein
MGLYSELNSIQSVIHSRSRDIQEKISRLREEKWDVGTGKLSQL